MIIFGFWARYFVMWAQWVCSVLCDVYMCGSGNVVCVCYSYPHDNYNFLATTVSMYLRVYRNGVYGGMLIRFVYWLNFIDRMGNCYS